MKKFVTFLAILAVLVSTGISFAKGGFSSGGGRSGGFSSGGSFSSGRSSFSSSPSRSSFSSGVSAHTAPTKPFASPINKVSAGPAPSVTGQPVKIVPSPRPATVVNKTVINKTVVNHNSGGGYYGGGSHFWSNWMMFSLLTNHPAQTVVVAGQPGVAGGAVVQSYPPRMSLGEVVLLCFIVVLVIAGMIVALYWWADGCPRRTKASGGHF